MTRAESKRKVRLDSFRETMREIVTKVDKETLDESLFVYKEIGLVLTAQQGVVSKVANQLRPLVNIKGG